MKNLISLIVLLTLLVNLSVAQKTLVYDDYVYSENIKTVLLFPQKDGDNAPKNHLRPSVTSLNTDSPLVLEFDDLSFQYQNYHVKFVPCSIDWKPLNLNEVEFISEYNDFIIADYHMSFSTKVAYYHYKFQLPQMKIAGNFLIYVYKERNKNDLVLSRRFIINSNKVGISGAVNYSTNLANRYTHQQLEFDINYAGYQILNPQTDVKIVIRQNFRWDKTKSNFKPQFNRQGESILEYKFYNSEADFEGGNEFRFFDTRSLRSRMVGVRNINYLDNGYEVMLYNEKIQGNKTYVFTDDFDGKFLIDHYENGNGETQADYANVKFILENPNIEDREFYVIGAFNDYQCNAKSKMTYNETAQSYTLVTPLKQGIYNFQFVSKDLSNNVVDQVMTEGTHSRTQNTYEIFVYQKTFGSRYEPLIGYKILEYNLRK
jgi:Domain of unknown function (DUF5103)